MNKLLNINVRKSVKLSTLLCSVMLLSACAGTNVVKLESSVEQLKDLNDLDRDGVIEAREKCADTVLGASIDNHGCGTSSTIVEPLKVDIKFVNNSYDIPTSALPKIKELADFLKQNLALKVLIEGHTSKVGNALLNQILSDNRAQAVVSVLVNDFGISTERVSGKGFGFERQANPRDSDAAHAANRRILANLSQTVNIDDMFWTIYTVD